MITLSERFSNDIQGKDTYLIPLVIIDNRFYLSTNKLTLENHYDPLVKSIGNIKESIDTTSKKFKISSVSIKFFNFEYNGERITDRLFEQSVMNSRVDIYYKSPSCESLEDCMKLYSGYIRDIKENADLLSIEIEDVTETSLHKKVPYRYTPSEGLPEKHQNKLIPMVYGFVDKSPLVYSPYPLPDGFGDNKFILDSDDLDIKSIDVLQIFTNDVYLNVKRDADLLIAEIVDTLYQGLLENQWIETNNQIIIDKTVSTDWSSEATVDYGVGTPLTHGFAEIEQTSDVKYVGGVHKINYDSSGEIKTNIMAFQDSEGTIESDGNTDGLYLMIKQFGNEHELDFGIPSWVWGDPSNIYLLPIEVDGEVVLVYYGESFMTFEINSSLASDSDLLKGLVENVEGDIKEIKGIIKLNYDFEAFAKDNPTANEPTYPILFFSQVGLGFGMPLFPEWDSQGLLDYETISKSGDTSFPVKDITSNKFSIGDSAALQAAISNLIDIFFDWFGAPPSDFQFDSQALMDWFKINHLNVTRTAILKDFNKYDLYASVDGRVDDINGTYTGQGTTVLGGEVGTQQRQEIAISRPQSPRPVKQVKQVKKKTDKGSAY